LDCFDYAGWCDDIDSYCNAGGSKGKCSKSDCFSKWAPKGGKPATTTTSVYACAPTTTTKGVTTKPATTTKAATTTSKSTSTSSTQCPIPTATGICQQPTSWVWGYGTGNPVGGIELPIVTCNDLKDDFNKGNQFKLYTDSDSSKCGSYPRPSVPNACADACKAQYDNCVATYAEGCKSNSGGSSGSSGSGKSTSSSSSSWSSWFKRRGSTTGNYFDWAKAPNKRTYWTDSYSTASSKCSAQYTDCLSQNKGVSGSGKCGSWGTGW